MYLVIVPRALGTSQMGDLTAAASVIAILVVLTAGCVTVDYLVRRLVLAGGEAAQLTGAALIMRLLMLPIFALAVVVYVRATGVSHGVTSLFYFLIISAAANRLIDPFLAGFKAKEQMGYVGLSNV
ncbi:MAG: hypothetical protein ACRDYY_12800, partial [Acidimicrobiales bacterium]